jgi:peroxiredoxin
VSQFCGPVTEMVGDLAKTYATKARFIHIEVWKDYKAQQLNDAAKEWIAKGEDINEPWVFVIGADGKVSVRFDNVVTRGELETLLQKLPPMKA